MKIEMGESLVRTWVRHCRGCQLAELNWKPSPIWPGEITEEHQRWYSEAAVVFPRSVLGKTSGIRQFLSQAEIDVLGVRFIDGKAAGIIAADIAFHSGGLLYVNNEETAARVLKKLFRTALTLDIHFPGVPAELLFLSPKAFPATVSSVREAERAARSFFEKRRAGFHFQAIFNEGFKADVLDAVNPLRAQIADTSELYLRAIQLTGLFTD